MVFHELLEVIRWNSREGVAHFISWCSVCLTRTFFLSFSVDIPTANETLLNIVNTIVQEWLRPDVNNLIPKQDWKLLHFSFKRWRRYESDNIFSGGSRQRGLGGPDPRFLLDFFYHLSLTKILAKTGSYVITQYQVYNVHLSCSISWLI